ncbi:hypothetical protein ACFX12_032962 [Malus domestica]
MWARTFKAQYFPYSSFFDAKLGSRASDTRLWIDRWLPSLLLGGPVPRGNNHITMNTKVSSLMCQSTRSWDLAFLCPFILDKEVNVILATHLGNLSTPYRLIWTAEKCGRYLVRSGYHWIHSRRLRVGASISSDALLWKAVWKINAPPKIRNFIQRAINETLSTMRGLFLRWSASSPVCPICKNQEECNYVYNAMAVVHCQVMHVISFSVASSWEAKAPSSHIATFIPAST